MVKRSIFAVAALGAMMLASGGAFAQDTMNKDTMSKDTMGKDTMGKDAMSKDSMGMDAANASGINNVDGVGLKGFDPVAYFDQHKPAKGTPANTASYLGVTYEFTSKQHADAFAKDPAKYVPTFNGFCATAVAEGVKADVDPHDFVVYKGKLNVFYSDEAKAVFVKNQAAVAAKAESNWPDVQKQTKVIR